MANQPTQMSLYLKESDPRHYNIEFKLGITFQCFISQSFLLFQEYEARGYF